jgi:hypothetical protein
MDERDWTDLRVIELALRNPRSGTPEAETLRQLSAQCHEQDSRQFPTATHPRTGALCFCRVHCDGARCRCWCHDTESS